MTPTGSHRLVKGLNCLEPFLIFSYSYTILLTSAYHINYFSLYFEILSIA